MAHYVAAFVAWKVVSLAWIGCLHALAQKPTRMTSKPVGMWLKKFNSLTFYNDNKSPHPPC